MSSTPKQGQRPGFKLKRLKRKMKSAPCIKKLWLNKKLRLDDATVWTQKKIVPRWYEQAGTNMASVSEEPECADINCERDTSYKDCHVETIQACCPQSQEQSSNNTSSSVSSSDNLQSNASSLHELGNQQRLYSLLPTQGQYQSNASRHRSPLEQETSQTKYFFDDGGNTDSSDQIPKNMSHDSKNPVHNEQSRDDVYNNGSHQYSEDRSKRYDHHTSRQVQPKCDHVQQLNHPQSNQRNSEDTRTESVRMVSVTDTATTHVYTPVTQLPEETVILLSNQQTTSQEEAENELFPAENRQEVLTSSSCESASSIPSQQAVADQHDEGDREQVPAELDNTDRPNITHMEQGDIQQDIDVRPCVIHIESNDRRFDIQLGDEIQDEDVVQLGNEMQDENPPWPVPTDIDIHRTGEFDFDQQRQERDIDIQSERRRRAEERSQFGRL